jgi:hypothetical protein
MPRGTPVAVMPATARRLSLLVRSLHGGGMERVISTLAEAFADRGHRVSLLVGVPAGAMLAHVPSSVELVPLARSSQLVARAWALAADPGAFRKMLPLLVGPAPRMLSHLPGLVRHLREARPDALLAAGTQSNLAALWARRFRGTATAIVVSECNTMSVVARRGRHGFRRAYPALARRAYPRADAIVAVSDGVAADLSRVTGMAARAGGDVRRRSRGGPLSRGPARTARHGARPGRPRARASRRGGRARPGRAISFRRSSALASRLGAVGRVRRPAPGGEDARSRGDAQRVGAAPARR